jgi:hypothetical protein
VTDPVAGFGEKARDVMDQGSAQKSASRPYAIVLSRLSAVENRLGLISFLIDTGEDRPAAKLGVLTDAALRGRLAYFDAHSANEIAAIRKALSVENGRAIVYEQWPALAGCIRFWYGFVGSKIRPIESACEACGKQNRGSVGGSVGESFLRACVCGRVARVTVPSQVLPSPAPAR